jgi:hypothetical protein
MITIALALTTGLFCGIAATLIYVIRIFLIRNHELEIERKILTNKAFIRDGQGKLYPDSMIDPEKKDSQQTGKTPTQVLSPLSQGKQKLRERLEQEKKPENSTTLPANVQAKIREQAEKIRNGEPVD